MVWIRKENNPKDPNNCNKLTKDVDTIIVPGNSMTPPDEKIMHESKIIHSNDLINRKGRYIGCLKAPYKDDIQTLIGYRRSDNVDTWVIGKYYYVLSRDNPNSFGKRKSRKSRKRSRKSRKRLRKSKRKSKRSRKSKKKI